jgi:hypothetical protein
VVKQVIRVPAILNDGAHRPVQEAIRRANANFTELYGRTVSVKDFGAVGDGVTDDTAAIQAAASSLVAGTTLLFDGGNFVVSDDIAFTTSNIRIAGHLATITQTGTAKKTIKLTSVTGAEICGLKLVGKGSEFVGGATSYNGVAGIYLNNCQDVEIHSNILTNHAGGSIRWTGTSVNLRIHNNKVSGIGSAGGIVAGDNGNDVGIGSQSATADNDIQISENRISDHSFGCFLARGTGCKISENRIKNIPGQHAIYQSEMSDTVVVGNVISDIEQQAILNQIATNSTTISDYFVTDNLITRCRDGVILNLAAGVTGSKFLRVKVSNNLIHNMEQYGIFSDVMQESVVSDNQINDIKFYGIILQGVSGEIKNNTIRYTGWQGLRIEAVDQVECAGNSTIDCVQNFTAEAAQARNRYTCEVTRHASFVATTPRVSFVGNTFRNFLSDPTNWLNTIRWNANTQLDYLDNVNLTSKTYTNNTGTFGKFGFVAKSVSADSGDAAKTLTAETSEDTQIWNTPITADRAVTLSTTGAFNGAKFHIVRTAAATGAFNLNVGTGPLKALTAGQWCDVEYDGSAWILTGFGSL